MDADFYLGSSANLPSAALPKGAINGIAIDNPSGSWLLVEPIHLFVPPYVSGWQNPVSNAFSVSVTWVNSPSGSVSDPSMPPGIRVHVHLSGDTLPHADGFVSGAGARQSIIPPSITAFVPASAPQTGVGNPQTLAAISATTRRIVIRRLEIVPDYQAGPGGPVPYGHAFSVWFGPGPPLNSQWYLAVSPETPFAEAAFEDGVFVLPGGQNLMCEGITEIGGGSQQYIAMAQYYEEVA